jgi:hypothetical protein
LRVLGNILRNILALISNTRIIDFINEILQDIYIFFFRLLGTNICLVCSNSENSNNGLDNKSCFSDNNNPENNNSENNNSNPNNNNSDNDDSSEVEEGSDVEEVENHNGPEEIMNDLEQIDKANKGDDESKEQIKEKYKEFFKNGSDKEGLKQVEEYLEGEFKGELYASEREADAIGAKDEAKRWETLAKDFERQAEETSGDEVKKTNLEQVAEYFQKKADDKHKEAEEAMEKVNRRWESNEEMEDEFEDNYERVLAR